MQQTEKITCAMDIYTICKQVAMCKANIVIANRLDEYPFGLIPHTNVVSANIMRNLGCHFDFVFVSFP